VQPVSNELQSVLGSAAVLLLLLLLQRWLLQPSLHAKRLIY
jgi:hypothetical protein